MAKGDTKTNQYLDIAANGTRADLPTDTCCETRSQTLIREVAERIIDLEEEVQELEDNPDVADIVDTYADLMAYDTSTLTDRDIIRVLNDETHDGESTYYRYSKATDSWTYIGSTGQRAKQSDWDEDNSTDMAFIKNKPFYSESVDSDFEQEPTTTSGSTPDTNYVWFIEQFQDYALHEVLADFNDGDTVYATITYSVNGVERSDTGKFTLTFEGDQANLDYDAPAGSRWYGAYISEVNLGDTTVRWPVLATDSGATVYITNIEYNRVKQLDAEYIPIDNDTIRVNADGELQATSSGATYIAGDGIDITNAVISATNTGKARVLTAADYNYPTNNPNGVAVWLLDDGIYTTTSGVQVYRNTTSSTTTPTTFIYSKGSLLWMEAANSDTGIRYSYLSGAGTDFPVASGFLLKSSNVKDNLTSTSTSTPLSANQGRVLKDLIDSLVVKGTTAPTTSTTGTVGQLYEDTTNGDLYQLKSIDTSVTPNEYNWEAVGGGSGPTVVQTTGTSTTDVMSQNAVTSMVFADASSTNEGIKIGANATTAGIYHNSRVQIGNYSVVNGGNGAVVVGDNAKANGVTGNDFGMTALGIYAKAEANSSIALGAGSHAVSKGEINVGIDPSSSVSWLDSYGYNNSNYRLLTGLYDGQSAHDAVTKGQLDSIAIQNAGAPTTATVGTVGQLLEDTTNGDLYICTDATNPYVWEEVGAGGGGPTVVQTTGTSTTDVMSQDAVTQTIFDGLYSGLTNHIAIGTAAATQGGRTANASVSVGSGARANGEFGIAIGGYGSNGFYATADVNGIAIGGYNPNASGNGSIAIGTYGATASGKGSIALGYAASATAQGQVDIGSTSTSYGYNSSNYRLLTGLYDPQSAHDAATKGYVDPTTDSSAPTSATVGRLGEIRIDTTTNTAYMCVLSDSTTPAYEWKQITA